MKPRTFRTVSISRPSRNSQTKARTQAKIRSHVTNGVRWTGLSSEIGIMSRATFARILRRAEADKIELEGINDARKASTPSLRHACDQIRATCPASKTTIDPFATRRLVAIRAIRLAHAPNDRPARYSGHRSR